MRALLCFVLVLAACSSKTKPDPGPTCDKVVDNMLIVMKQGLTGHDSVQLGNRDQMIAQCEQRNMTADERRCLATATDLAGLAACRPAKPGARPRSPVPAQQLPAGSASGVDGSASSAQPVPAERDAADGGSAGSGG